MADQTVTRKLAAILAADVVGYSRLMGAAEEETARTLHLYREVVDGLIAARGGRVFGSAGDSVIAEFASPVEAVRAAVEIQAAIEKQNADAPEDRRMRFRIGVNLGDVLVEGDNLLGDGVNVAARLEALAEPGGVCISRPVLDQIEGKLDAAFDDAGTHQVKNIARPIHVWRWRNAETGAATVASSEPLPLPDKPSIAVLPFESMGGDPEQEYFADGITEDIITALSQHRWFFVIARNSSFTYKDRTVDVKQAGRELGVRYVLEGSVRKAGNRVRLTGQLIDTATGNHIWAHRYDRELADIFEVQDELTQTVVAAVEPELGKAERERSKSKRPENLGAWDLYQRGMWHLYRRTNEELAEAQSLFRRALELDPNLTPALCGSVDAYYYEIVLGLAASPADSLESALGAARHAVELDADDAAARCAMGKARMVRREHEAAILEFERALELNPSLAWAYYGLGATTVFAGRDPRAAIPNLQQAIRLSPRDPHMGSYLVRLADAYLWSKDYAQAEEWARKALREPGFQWSRYAVLLAALGHLGRMDEAAEVRQELAALRPDFSLAFVRATHLYSDNDTFAHFLDGLRQAGLPD